TAAAAAGLALQHKPAGVGLSWESGSGFFARQRPWCRLAEQGQRCPYIDGRSKPQWYRSDVDRFRGIEEEGCGSRNAVWPGVGNSHDRCTSTDRRHDDGNCPRCRCVCHSQLNNWTFGADTCLSRSLESKALLVPVTATSTWLSTRLTSSTQSTYMKEPVCSGFASSCGSDPVPFSVPREHVERGPTVGVRSHLTLQRRRDTTLPTHTTTLLFPLPLSSTGL